MEAVFNTVITKVNYRRKAVGPEFNGLDYWHRMKTILARLQSPAGITGGIATGETAYTWAPREMEDSEDYEHVMQLPEFNEDGSVHVANHSIIQLVRIPRKYPCTITKVMQIAFDIGQFASLGEFNYQRLVQLGLDDITEYITPDVEHLMDQTIIANPIIVDELLSM